MDFAAEKQSPWRVRVLVGIALTVAVALLFWSAPQDGEFWWSDSPRHALNGVFIMDLLRAMPIHDPAGFAIDYYTRYPALTVLFYPPLFYFLSAPVFWGLGVSHTAALIPVMVADLMFGAGCYALARRWLDRPAALGTALALVGAPEIALWGRQVMLELPCYAFLIWAVWGWFRHLGGPPDHGQSDSERWGGERWGGERWGGERWGGERWGIAGLAVALLAAALYVKLSVLFMIPVFGLALVLYRGFGALRDRRYWLLGMVAAVALIPLAVITVKFGQANVQSVVGVSDAVVARTSWAGWLWYLERLPDQLGWPIVLLAAAGLATSLALRSWRIAREDALILLAWVVIGYGFFSSIDLKEARHSVFLLFPVVLMAGLLVMHALSALPASWRWLRQGTAPVLGAAVLAATLIGSPVPSVAGYRQAADRIAELAPRDSVVLFSGKRDGSFIFNLRTHEERRDLKILRADKLLLRVAVRRELGVEQKEFSDDEVIAMLARYRVHYVVAQTGFWTDLAAMAQFEHLLHSDRFEPVARIPIEANVPTEDRELVIYRNRAPVADQAAPLMIDLPIIGRKIEGAL